jgi:16S rRNA (guanine527-N7)-methyltransferase
LAILFPETRLIDIIGKKIKVVQAVAEALELKMCRAIARDTVKGDLISS